MSQRYGERVRLVGGFANATVATWLSRLATGGVIGIKTIQQLGCNVGANTLTTAVTPANCILLHCGNLAPAGAAAPNQACGRLDLTSTTQITLTNGGGGALAVAAVLLEFLAGVIKTRQTGIATIGAAATSQVATLGTAVNPARALLCPVGYTTTRASLNNADIWMPWHVLTGAGASVTATRSTASADTIDQGYQVIELL